MSNKKPLVVCHMISTIDGRLIVDRYSKPADKKMTVADYIKEYYDLGDEEIGTRVILNGRNTLLSSYTKLFEDKGYQPTTNPVTFKAVNHPREWTQVVIDFKGKTFYENIPDSDDVITILSEKVSDEYLAHLRENNVSYLFAGTDEVDLNRALELLYSDFGINKLILEGGGITNGLFLKAGLIDAMSLSIYPGIDGKAGMPTIFEYLGKDDFPALGQTLELKKSKILPSGLVWLYYKFGRE